MSVGLVEFYSMRGSLSSGEYPLVTGAETPVHSTTAKYEAGLQTEIKVPIFRGYDAVNVTKIGGSYYWITEFMERTNANGQIIFVLDYMAPTSLLRSSDTITGIWKRTPTNKCPYLQDQITNGVMASSRTIEFDELECPQSKSIYETYWIQVSGHDNNGNIKRYGGFIAYNDWVHDFDWTNTILSYQPNGTPVWGDYVPYGYWLSHMYEITGLTDQDIDDVSISKRCPYKPYVHQLDTNLYAIALESQAGLVVSPSSLTIGTDTFYYYNISDNFLGGVSVANNSVTKTVSLSARERLTGHVGIRDWNRNEIMIIDAGRSSDITITAEMHSDVSGIYTVISVFDDQISIPEGKLPYFGNSKATYKAYSMDSDRQAMQYAIQNAHYNRETSDNVTIGNTASGSLQGLAMGALTGNPVTAVSGIMSGVASGIASAYQNQRAMELSIIQAQQDANLSRKRAIDQPTSGYNVGYGSIYAYLNEISPLCINVKQPANINNLYYAGWAENFGYPAEGRITLSVVTGYYQGKILNDGTIIGMYFDELSKSFANGFKFVTP